MPAAERRNLCQTTILITPFSVVAPSSRHSAQAASWKAPTPHFASRLRTTQRGIQPLHLSDASSSAWRKPGSTCNRNSPECKQGVASDAGLFSSCAPSSFRRFCLYFSFFHSVCTCLLGSATRVSSLHLLPDGLSLLLLAFRSTGTTVSLHNAPTHTRRRTLSCRRHKSTATCRTRPSST